MANRIQFRRDTSARWTSINPTLQEGELGIETDTRFTKVGDGVHAWNDLQYATAVHNITHILGSSENLVMSQKGVQDAINTVVANEDENNTELKHSISEVDSKVGAIKSLLPYDGRTLINVSVETASTVTEGGKILFNPFTNCFLYFVNSKYYSSWKTNNSGVHDQYNYNFKARKDRLFILDDILWYFDGNELTFVRDYLMQDRGHETTVAMSQDAVTKNFEEIEKYIWPLETNLQVQPRSEEYTGEAKTVTISWNLTRNGQTIDDIKIDSLIISVDEQEYIKSNAEDSMTVSINKSGGILIEISANTTDNLGNAEGIEYKQFLPIYCGFDTEDTTITNLNKFVKQSVVGSYTLDNDTNGKYFWLCVPDELTVNRVTLNGFDVPMESYITKSTSLGSYKCYRSSNALEAKTFIFKVE